MSIFLATSNKGKVKEISEFLGELVIPYTDVIEAFDIEEHGDTFGANALIKAKAVYEKLPKNSIVIADDSGISVPLFGGEPGIYSARYAGVNASDKDNLNKLISELKKADIKKTPAFYTAAIALVCEEDEFVVHGWMHGDVIDEIRGNSGFGYDPMFIPEGYEQTLGELPKDIKSDFSHRIKALRLIVPIIEMIKRGRI
ncbi:MAG: nucleoside-triphosphate diphosphatase [Sulfurovum sp. AS07-7]|nr:MAG: nucleoside-triphosphate diphosphatase [Sulfurovum sp. AS07-7]